MSESTDWVLVSKNCLDYNFAKVLNVFHKAKLGFKNNNSCLCVEIILKKG